MSRPSLPFCLKTMRRHHVSRNYNFTGVNVSVDEVPQQSNHFILDAAPSTSLWRNSAGQDDLTAPILVATPPFTFVSAEVTVSAKWSLERDQAGLALFIGHPTSTPRWQHTPVSALTELDSSLRSSEDAESQAPPPAYARTALRWVKLGLELGRDSSCVSTATSTSHGTDWTITPASSRQADVGDIRLKMERVGHSLWLSCEDSPHSYDLVPVPASRRRQQQQARISVGSTSVERESWRKLREISDFFLGVEDKSVRVGVYASRPAGLHATAALNVDEHLVVDFEDLVIY